MTKRQYLALMRQPEYAGINARRILKDMAKPSGKSINRKIALNAIGAAARNFAKALKDSREESANA